ncbi:MAG TPA: Hsp20/alpha crystallin family protein [Polyangiaceae bacterium]|nr:Hsp20/alpha crystallin family protein [Polyangiaceae bacterium]
MAEVNRGNTQNQSIESRQPEARQSTGEQRLEPYGDRFLQARSGSPFSLMRRWMNDMDRWFGDFGGTSLLPRFDEAFSQALWSPQIDIFERQGSLIVHADLPGLRQEDVRVNVDRGMLTISGQRRQETTSEREQGNVYHRERSFGSFQRSISLPDGVDAAQIRASFDNGVLEVAVPIPEQARQQGRDIPIGPKQQSGPKH